MTEKTVGTKPNMVGTMRTRPIVVIAIPNAEKEKKRKMSKAEKTLEIMTVYLKSAEKLNTPDGMIIGIIKNMLDEYERVKE
ncbi:MAG: hypothetical protein ACUZ9M_00710 [Candidatus Scalindua sp.]